MDFNDLIDDKEFFQLRRQFPKLEMCDHTLNVDRDTFDYWHNVIVTRRDRRGEVVLVIENSAGKILLHTKTFYPKGLYRLPTGGIHIDERVLVAIERETYEETGLKVVTKKFLGIIQLTFQHNNQTLPFVSYVVHLFNKKGKPRVIDPEENIADFRFVPIDVIAQVSQNLKSLSEKWKYWGRFRAIAHDLVYDKLS